MYNGLSCGLLSSDYLENFDFLFAILILFLPFFLPWRSCARKMLVLSDGMAKGKGKIKLSKNKHNTLHLKL